MFVATSRRFDAVASVATSNFQDPSEAQSFIGVWSIDDDGDVAPRWTVAHDILKEVRNLAIDPKNKTVMVADKGLNAIMTFSFPEAFEAAGLPKGRWAESVPGPQRSSQILVQTST